MKSYLSVLFLMLVLISGSCKNAGKAPENQKEGSLAGTEQENAFTVKKYQIKSGIVTYENEMMGIKQKTVLYFDDFGMKEAEEKYDESDNIRETNLCDGKNRYLLIHSQKTAYTSGTCYRGVAYKFDWDEISKADKEQKASKLPNVNVAGKDCESYSFNSGDFPTVFAGWNNICLSMNSESKFGKVITKAVKLEENVSIPDAKFQVPEGFEIKKGL